MRQLEAMTCSAVAHLLYHHHQFRLPPDGPDNIFMLRQAEQQHARLCTLRMNSCAATCTRIWFRERKRARFRWKPGRSSWIPLCLVVKTKAGFQAQQIWKYSLSVRCNEAKIREMIQPLTIVAPWLALCRSPCAAFMQITRTIVYSSSTSQSPFLINSITAHLALIASIVILLFWAVQFTQRLHKASIFTLSRFLLE